MKTSYKNIIKIAYIALAILTLLGIIKALFVSIDVDESYAVAQAYRLVTGDKIMYDMWEPHQFSAFLPAFFLYPFVKITGSTDYCVIFLRICGVLVHTALGAFLFFVAQKEINKEAALFAFLFHMNFLPKWICMPEFELMHYWSVLAVFLLLLLAEKNKNFFLYFLAGICFGVSVLCYPSMIPVFFVLIIGLAVKKKKEGILPFFAGTLLVGLITAAVILINVSPSRLPFFVSYILMDSSHTSAGLSYKLATYPSEIKARLPVMIAALAIGTFLSLGYLLIGIFIRKIKVNAYSFVQCLLFYACMLLCIITVFGFVFDNRNQFYLQSRYVLFALLFAVIAVWEYKRFSSELWYAIIPSVVTVPMIFFITNMDSNSLYSKLFISVIAGIFILGKKYFSGEISDENQKNLKILSAGCIVLCLVCLIFCRLLLVRVNGCMPVTVKASLEKVENGPAKGLFILKDQAEAWNSSYDAVKEVTDSGKNILFIGQEQLFYVTFADRVCVPSVQGTTAFNEMYTKYYDVFPDKYPEIVVRDASFDVNPAYYYSDENEYIFRWLKDSNETASLKNTGYYEVLSIKKK